MRVIAGEFRSRKLKSVPGLATRPTPDRLRETLFDILGAGLEGGEGDGAVAEAVGEALAEVAGGGEGVDSCSPGSARSCASCATSRSISTRSARPR